jgi:type II restriction enzyme
MLEDKHLKVQFYELKSVKVFTGTDIKGGVAITYHDADKEFGTNRRFTIFEPLNSIIKKS